MQHIYSGVHNLEKYWITKKIQELMYIKKQLFIKENNEEQIIPTCQVLNLDVLSTTIQYSIFTAMFSVHYIQWQVIPYCSWVKYSYV